MAVSGEFFKEKGLPKDVGKLIGTYGLNAPDAMNMVGAKRLAGEEAKADPENPKPKP